jgi:4-diphosphocytidyl-2-C-methyl-D-erythritol kinase
MGAGLGGGSSDAAWTLRMLNEIDSLGLKQQELFTFAAQLGSDCAFFVQDKPMVGEGRGELLSPTSATLQDKFLVLIKPGIHVSTSHAFSGVKPKTKIVDLRSALENSSIDQWRTVVKNDFEDSVFVRFPEIEKIKNQLYESGALYASMSGSGSAVFGIFSNPVDLRNKFSGMTYWAAKL